MIPNRIELAARADWERTHGTKRPSFLWENIRPEIRADRLDRMRVILAAAFPDAPGLFSDPPQVWFAPMEATEAMREAGVGARWMSAVRDANNVLEIFGAMRDAHLAGQSDNPKGDAK